MGHDVRCVDAREGVRSLGAVAQCSGHQSGCGSALFGFLRRSWTTSMTGVGQAAADVRLHRIAASVAILVDETEHVLHMVCSQKPSTPPTGAAGHLTSSPQTSASRRRVRNAASRCCCAPRQASGSQDFNEA